MSNPNFKLARTVAAAALAVSLLILAFCCVMPQRKINNTYKAVEQDLVKAFNAVYADDYESAYIYCERVRDRTGKELGILEVYFDHSLVFDLYSASRSAAAMAKTEDPSQLLEELSELASALDYLYRIHKLNIYNIF